MRSQEYKSILATIIRNTLKKEFSCLHNKILLEASFKAAKAIHARMYGANVDGVETPIWRDHPFKDANFTDAQPTKTAQEILNE